MDFNKPPSLKEFAYYFSKYLDDIGCVNNSEGYIASHKIIGGIRVYDVDEDDETDFEIVGIDFEQLMGCGCPSDIIIKIKKIPA